MPDPEPTRCPVCGQLIRIAMPLGLCPCCLMKAATTHPGPLAPDPSVGTAASLPQGFGDYEILEEIGRGGMGLVYKARQKSLNRIVALKMMLGGQFATAQARARFKVEAESTAHLQHPHIVAIHEVGEHEGLPYLVMDYVAGRGLDTLAREQPLPARSAATYVATIAEAIAYAHEQGILHRDLKPSNVLIDDKDEVRITDFGLAKRLVGMGSTPSHSISNEITDEVELVPTHLTLSGQALGSPNYMPPEQAAGQHQRIGPASDVYGMGATLYYLVTGRPPFVGETISTTTRQVMENEPISPRLLNPKLPRDLETICLKCLEKDPAKRYATAQELADELGRFLRDEPIRARPPGLAEKGWRWCRRKPALAGLALVFMLGVAGVAWQWRRAVESARVAEHHLYVASMNLGRQSWEENQMGRLWQLLWDTRTYPDRGFEWFYLQRLAHPEVRTFRGHSDFLRCVVFTPDGRQLISSANDGTARVWDIGTGHQVLIFKPPINRQDVYSVVIRPDGAQAASTGTDGVQVWDSKTGRLIRVIPGGGRPLGYSADGRRILAQRRKASAGAEAAVWDANTGEELLVLRGHVLRPDFPGWQVEAGAFSPDGRWIVTGAVDATVRIWDAGTGQSLRVLTNHTDPVHALAFSPDSARFVSAGGIRGENVIVWDAATGQPVRALRGHIAPVRTAAYSPDGRWIVTGGVDQTARIYEVESGREVRMLRGHSGQVAGVAVSPDGKRIATASDDGTIKLWNVDTAWLRQPAGGRQASSSPDPSPPVTTDRGEVVGNTRPVLIGREVAEGWELVVELQATDRSAAQTSATPGELPHPARRLPIGLLDNRTLATMDTNQGTVALWSIDTRAPLALLSMGRNLNGVAALSPDRNRMLIDSGNNTAEAWDVPGRRPLFRLQLATNIVSAAFSPDGRHLVTQTGQSLLEIWDASTGARRHSIRHANNQLTPESLAIDPDSRVFLSSEIESGVARLWNLSDASPVMDFRVQRRRVSSVNGCFSPDGRRILTVGGLGLNIVWDRRSGSQLCSLVGHAGGAFSGAFSPDGRRVVTGGSDRTVRVGNARDGRELLTLKGHEDMVFQVAFSPNGREIYSIGDSKVLRIWLSAPPGQAGGAED